MVFLALSAAAIVAPSAAGSAETAAVYQRSVDKLKQQRQDLAARFRRADDARARRALIAESRRRVFDALRLRLFPAWLGTAWDYNGTSRTPGEGTIACGSFVVFTLQDAGFRIPSRMLRQPSENIIMNLTTPDAIRRFANARPMDEIVGHIRRQGNGLYMVGLDNHVGFLVNEDGRITFWHSTVFAPRPAVIRQDAYDFSPLTLSRYRVIGRLLGDEMMAGWLTGRDFPIVHDYFGRRN